MEYRYIIFEWVGRWIMYSDDINWGNIKYFSTLKEAYSYITQVISKEYDADDWIQAEKRFRAHRMEWPKGEP